MQAINSPKGGGGKKDITKKKEVAFPTKVRRKTSLNWYEESLQLYPHRLIFYYEQNDASSSPLLFSLPLISSP